MLGPIEVRARTGIISIDVMDSEIKEGYLTSIKTTESIVEASVCSSNGICHIFTFNTTDDNNEIELTPQEIIPFEYYKLPEDHVLEIVREFPNNCYLPGEPLTPTHLVQHKIHTLDDVPINTRPYQFSPSQREEVERVMHKTQVEGAI